MTEEIFIDPMRDSGGYLTPEQFETLMSFAKSQRDRVLMSFIFYTGRRVSEVVRCLKPQDFNFKDNMVCFKILKRRRGGEYRTWISVTPSIMSMINKYIQDSSLAPDEWIFPMSRIRVDQILRDIGKMAAPIMGWTVNDDGIPFIGKHLIHVHMLRHSFAIMTVRNIPNEIRDFEKLNILQRAMGHGLPSSSLWYVNHFGNDILKETLEKNRSEVSE
jgi:integrase